MQLTHSLSLLNETLLKLPQQKIAKGISIMLLCYIAYLGAKITWMFVPQVSQNVSIVSTEVRSATKQGHVNLSNITALNLFGRFTDAPKIEELPVQQDAPETRLKLTLSGVVASSNPSVAAAIIENSGKQETYGIGDTISGTKALLENIFSDRVLIKQSGRLETLMLDGVNYDKVGNNKSQKITKKSSYEPSPNIVDQRKNRDLTESASSLKADINDDPSKIIDYLKISPKRESGEVVGYQLMPGKNPEFFQDAGLKSGDVAIQMNGYDLSVPSEAAQALQALKQESEVSLLLDRDGELTEILFSIDK